jgi:TPR repeat protein
VHRSELEGGDDFCKGATHFVKRADVGAFAYAAGTKVEAGMSAKAFGQGTNGDTKSDEVRTKKDGDQAACKASKLADGAAPEGCGAGIRVSLAPIKDAGPSKDESVSKAGVSDGLGCPKGFVYADGACTANAGAKAFLCNEGDDAECAKQCAAGSDPSCDRYARTLLYRDDEMKDEAKTMAAIKTIGTRFEAACAADQPAACTALGVQLFMEIMGKHEFGDKPKVKRAFDFMASACRAGDYVGCSFLRFTAGDPDMQKETGIDGETLFEGAITKGCASGNAAPCGFMAFEHAAGKGKLPRDPKKALELADKACLGSFTEACQFHAALLSDEARCEKIWSGTSDKLSHVYDPHDLCEVTSAIPDNANTAKQSLQRACSLGAKSACGG